MNRGLLKLTFPLLLATFLPSGCDRSTATQSNGTPTQKTMPTTHPIDPRVAAFFGGTEMTDIITNPNEVQAFRLDDGAMVRQSKAPIENAQKIDDRRIIGGPVAVTGQARQILISNLTDPGSYFFDAASGCMPHWDIAYRFRKSDHLVDVVICLHCGIIENYYDGNPISGSEASYMSNGARLVAQDLFPNDTELKNLRSPGDP